MMIFTIIFIVYMLIGAKLFTIRVDNDKLWERCEEKWFQLLTQLLILSWILGWPIMLYKGRNLKL